MFNNQRFKARFVKSGFGATSAQLPNDLILTPQTWSASDRGGCKQATLSAEGSGEALASLTGWLGDRVEIYSDTGDLVWHGVLWDMEISVGNVVLTLSLDNVYNRVAVIYPHINADGSTESRTTTWAEDANSVARYGKREMLYGLPESWTSSAESVRDTLLARLCVASPIIGSQSGSSYGAHLSAMGLWQKSDAVYFTNLDGLVEHQGESGSFLIGRYLTSNQISFGTSTPAGLGTGSEADEVVIASGDFTPLTTGDTFTISGAANGGNNGVFTVDHMDGTSNIQIAISGTFVDEAAGATVKISYGDGISYDNIAMSFETTTAWTCTHVAVKCRQVGSPTDNFRIGIYPDSAGVPGTVLTANETVGSALYTELTWTEFAFATPVALAANTTYYIGIRRTGSASLADGYEVALDEDLGYADGTAQFYTGAAWVTRSPDADMPFRVIGEIDSTEQLGKALAVVEDFDSVLMQVDSNIPVRQYSADERSAREEMEEMLDAGTSTGDRLVAWVTSDGTVVVRTETIAGFGDVPLLLGADGRLKFGNGNFYPPGRLIYGQRIEMESLQLLAGTSVSGARSNSVYVVSSTYEAATDILNIESLGALDPWRALTTRRG